MRLIIAEKPSLGREIAAVLGIESKKDGHIVCRGNSVVTWCFGHLFELAQPEDYNPAYKRWDLASLPIIPSTWKKKKKPANGIAEQLQVIRSLLEKATTVVNAGDPDREGQLLIDEILEEFKCKKPVERIWLASLDEKSVRHALGTMKPNADYLPLRNAAEARSRADWLVGMNLTRAMTCLGRLSGFDGVISAGRVQSPTLMLVVNRDREIESFKPITYFVPTVKLRHAKGEFTAALVIEESLSGLDPDGRLIDRAVAEKLLTGLKGQTGEIIDFKREDKKVVPPAPYRLSSLQKDASARFGLSAQETLDIAQSLYEEKLTTYPRTDCDFLPEEQFGDAKEILTKLGNFQGADRIDPARKSKAWNTAKVTAHHAIIPTGQRKSLEGTQAKIYGLIVEGYARQFMPDYRYQSEKTTVALAGRRWTASGTRLLEAGWKFDATQEPLPDMIKKDPVECLSALIEEKKTQPPSRFTEGTLIEAMTQIHKYVQDARKKALLKENSGIGTEATRARIIETLKQRGYLKTQGKQKTLLSTDLGRKVADFLPAMLKDPGTTAIWEDYLEKVGSGELTVDDFIARQGQAVKGLIEGIGQNRLDIKPAHSCEECGSALRRYESNSRKGVYFWACVNSFEHPRFEDAKGKPGAAYGSGSRSRQGGEDGVACVHPGCDGRMRRMESKKKPGVFFWACGNQSHPLYQDKNGHPGDAFPPR